MKFRDYLESNTTLSESKRSFRDIDSVIGALADLPAAKKYRVKGAQYDDVIYKIPAATLKQLLSLTTKDLERMSKSGSYDGYFTVDKGMIHLGGGD